MSLTIDTDTLHRWALDNGYVRLADITEFVRHQSAPDPQQVVGLFTDASWARAGAPLEEVAHAAIDTANAVLDDKADDLFRPAVPGCALRPDEVALADAFRLDEPTSADTLAALRKVFTLKGEQASRDLLAKYGAKNAGTVPDDKRREFIAEAEELANS